MEKNGELHTPATLPPGKNPSTLRIRGWVVPQPVWTFQRRGKSQVSSGVQNPYLAACSTHYSSLFHSGRSVNED